MIGTYELAQSPAWPAMRVIEGVVSMPARAVNLWGCPILPLFLPGTPFKDMFKIPPTEDIKHAIGTVMEKGTVPETGRTGTSLLMKWKKLQNTPDSISAKPGPVSWPKVAAPQAATGE